MEELKPCPFCGELPQVAGDVAMHACEDKLIVIEGHFEAGMGRVGDAKE